VSRPSVGADIFYDRWPLICRALPWTTLQQGEISVSQLAQPLPCPYLPSHLLQVLCDVQIAFTQSCNGRHQLLKSSNRLNSVRLDHSAWVMGWQTWCLKAITWWNIHEPDRIIRNFIRTSELEFGKPRPTSCFWRIDDGRFWAAPRRFLTSGGWCAWMPNWLWGDWTAAKRVSLTAGKRAQTEHSSIVTWIDCSGRGTTLQLRHHQPADDSH